MTANGSASVGKALQSSAKYPAMSSSDIKETVIESVVLPDIEVTLETEVTTKLEFNTKVKLVVTSVVAPISFSPSWVIEAVKEYPRSVDSAIE